MYIYSHRYRANTTIFIACCSLKSNSNLKCIHIIPNLVQDWLRSTILERQFTETSGSFSVSSSSSSFPVNKCYCECNHELDHSKANYIALMLGGRGQDSYNFESTPMRAFLIGQALNLEALLLRYRRKNSGHFTILHTQRRAYKGVCYVP